MQKRAGKGKSPKAPAASASPPAKSAKVARTWGSDQKVIIISF